MALTDERITLGWYYGDDDDDTAPDDLTRHVIGRTFTAVYRAKAAAVWDAREHGEDALVFADASGPRLVMSHRRSCCEVFELHDINGDLADLVDTPILEAYESTSPDQPADVPVSSDEDEYRHESQTWTFYRFVTIKGTVVLRWWAASNGYYSESVDLVALPRPVEQP